MNVVKEVTISDAVRAEVRRTRFVHPIEDRQKEVISVLLRVLRDSDLTADVDDALSADLAIGRAAVNFAEPQ